MPQAEAIPRHIKYEVNIQYTFLGIYIIQLLPLSEGDMMICSPEAGNIARGRSHMTNACDYTCNHI